jgi:hypothetical protein
LEDGDWHAHPSPSGRNILFVATNFSTASPVPWIWVETESLAVIRSWKAIQSGWVSVSDHYIAMTACVWIYNCEPDIEIRSIDGNWRAVAPASRHNTPHPQFVDDDTLFLLGHPTKLIQTNGKVVFAEDEAPEGCWWGEAIPSAEGQRFVVPACDVKGAVAPLDIGGHAVLKRILLYDGPPHRRSYTLDVKGPQIKGMTQFAVSPDGSRLAILNNQSIEVLQLPPVH